MTSQVPTADQQAEMLAAELATLPFAHIVIIIEGAPDEAREREKLESLQHQIKTLDPAMIREVGYLIAEDAQNHEACTNQIKANVEWEYLDRLAHFEYWLTVRAARAEAAR
jgi:hypothetical protein